MSDEPKYHILKRVTDQGGTYYVSLPVNVRFTTPEALQDAAKVQAAKFPSETLYLVQEIGRVAIEPVITMTMAHPPRPVPRSADPVVQDEPEEPKRDPQAKPRLLVIDRKATPAEITGYLMVVAEGRIVKNAFGALELADMPLSGAEHLEVANALRGNLAS